MAEIADDKELDPHYREMLKYSDAPNSWYLITFVVSCVTALIVIYKTNSTLPWWGFAFALVLGWVSILICGVLYAITGFGFTIQPFVQMIGGFIPPWKADGEYVFCVVLVSKWHMSLASNACSIPCRHVNQAALLLRDLKIAQYTKLPPSCCFHRADCRNTPRLHFELQCVHSPLVQRRCPRLTFNSSPQL